jgi:mercuric ion binding protein
MRNTLLTLLAVFIFNGLIAQEKTSKFETVIIQISAQCGDCKTRIEDGLNYTKGVKFAELDLISKKVTVKYLPKKISIEQVKAKINTIGYDADDMKANPESILKLPACCQPGGMKQ